MLLVRAVADVDIATYWSNDPNDLLTSGATWGFNAVAAVARLPQAATFNVHFILNSRPSVLRDKFFTIDSRAFSITEDDSINPLDLLELVDDELKKTDSDWDMVPTGPTKVPDLGIVLRAANYRILRYVAAAASWPGMWANIYRRPDLITGQYNKDFVLLNYDTESFFDRKLAGSRGPYTMVIVQDRTVPEPASSSSSSSGPQAVSMSAAQEVESKRRKECSLDHS